ncbi:MAG: LD-carboxypeptidase [Oscillospiraceae bacterium]|nr:LD-carboxypeptidase [Oscillospiraceae bacterium]
MKGLRKFGVVPVLIVVVIFTALSSTLAVTSHANLHSDFPSIVVPEPLKVGDKVAIACPARNAATISDSRFAEIVEFLEDKGFEVVISDDMFEPVTPLNVGDGTEQLRADAFNALVRDPDIKALFCIRGGYGSYHLLQNLDYDAIRQNRPIIVGYSDITAMQTAILQNSGLVTFHGPMLSSNFGQEASFDVLFDMLMNKLAEPELEFALENINGTSFEVVNSGVAEGVIVGGNMTLISALMGTPYELDVKDKILFIEELDEWPYRLHSYIWQLKLSGKLDQAAAIVIGDILPTPPESHLATILEALKDVTVPILYNVRAGHDTNPLTIPIGATVKIDGATMKVVRFAAEEPFSPDSPDLPDTPDTPDTPNTPDSPGGGGLPNTIATDDDSNGGADTDSLTAVELANLLAPDHDTEGLGDVGKSEVFGADDNKENVNAGVEDAAVFGGLGITAMAVLVISKRKYNEVLK